MPVRLGYGMRSWVSRIFLDYLAIFVHLGYRIVSIQHAVGSEATHWEYRLRTVSSGARGSRQGRRRAMGFCKGECSHFSNTVDGPPKSK